MDSRAHLWATGWALVLFGFASGAGLGLGFHREAFMGGYGSWRRRLARLGHIACVMLGVLSMLFALTPVAAGASPGASSWAWTIGAIAMPLTCFAAAWKPSLRHLFAIPVVCLIAAASLVLAALLEGSPP